MDDVRDKRDLYNGFGNTLSRAIELVATPLIFGFGGHLLDDRLGTAPVLTIALAILCLVGMFVRAWYAYDADMRAHESAGPWSRQKR